MGSTTRLPIRRHIEPGATIVSASVKQWAALVDEIANDQNQVKLPSAARALRFAGLLDMGGAASVFPASGDPVPLFKDGRAYTNLAAGKSCVPGDLAVIANNVGDTEPYVMGTGTTYIVGPYKTKYTNAQAAGVPVETDYQPMLLVQAEPIRGFVRTIAANNTRYIGNDGTELAAVETLFEAPWDGTLQGPFRLDIEPGVGPAGLITATVQIKAPGGGWGDANVGAVPAAWAVALNAATQTTKDDTSVSLPYGNSLQILKGTKVGIKVVKDANVANFTQFSARITFW